MVGVRFRDGAFRVAVLGMVALLLVGTVTAAAPGLDFSDDRTPNPTLVENELVIAEHDRAEMDGTLNYYDDDGNVASLPADVNATQETPVGVRMDKVVVDAYKEFPRTEDEGGTNHANWTDTAHWTTDADATVADADADGVEKVELNITAAGGNATLAENVSITSDPDKRVLTVVGNINTLPASAELQVRAVDSDGDYRYANATTSDDADAEFTIANSTGNGYVFQEKLANLPMAGSGDDTMDDIVRVEIVSTGSNAKITLAGLDLDRKSEFDVGEIRRDTDDDGDLESTTVQNIYTAGKANLTGLDTLGSTFDSAIIKDLSVYKVRYGFDDVTDGDEYSVEFSSADEYTYPEKVEVYADMEVPSAIDLSHGDLELNFSQGLPEERYVTFEVAEDIDTDEEFGNFTDGSKYSDVTGSLGTQDDEHTLDSSVSADQTYRVHMMILLQTEEVSALQQTAPGGPVDSGGGLFGGFFSSVWGWLVAAAATVGGWVGINRVFGGG